MPVESLCRILAALPSVTELTVEANPETVDAHDMQRLCQAGVNRLSLGAQSFDDRQLQALGRGQPRLFFCPNAESGFEDISNIRKAGM